MAFLTDIGVNLLNSAFDRDRNEVLERAKNAGVKKIIITGSTIENSAESLLFVNDSSFINENSGITCYSTAGVHPHNAKDWNALSLAGLKDLISSDSKSKITAIGECGLDYNRNFSPPEAQKKCFEDQLAFAVQNKKPVFLHERDAFEDFYSILKKYKKDLSGAVVHCFTGTAAEMKAYLELDCYIGITGWICDERRGSHLIPFLRQIPANRLLLETDAPYLLPRNLPKSFRGKSSRNEPAFLSHIVAFAAGILGKTYEQIAEETSSNAAELFGI